jgi:hypothetical protein
MRLYKHRTTTRASERVRASMARIVHAVLQVLMIGILQRSVGR